MTISAVARRAYARRPLGFMETVMATMHQEFRGNTQTSIFVRLRGTLSFSHVEQAARALFAQYTALRCSIEMVDGVLEFREGLEFSSIPVRQSSLGPSETWEDVLLRDADHPLNPAQSLWRLSWFTDPRSSEQALVMACHHAMSDYIGLTVMVNQFLTFLDRLTSGLRLEIEEVELSPPIDEFLRPPLSAAPPKVPRSRIRPRKFAPIEKRHTKMHNAALDANLHELLKKRCQAVNLKPNSILSAALCLSCSAEGLVESPVPFGSAVSLRVFPALKQRGKPLVGCYLTVAETPTELGFGDLVEVARSMEANLLQQFVSTYLHRVEFDPAKLRAAIAARKDDPPFFQGFGITNVGDASIERTYSSFAILDVGTVVNRMAGIVALVLQVDTFDGRLRFRFVYTEPLLESAVIERISSKFLTTLATFIG